MLALRFRSKLWLYPGPGGWHFITLPVKHARTINSLAQGNRKGWGSLRVHATVGKTSWKTSIFPDKKSGSYILPVKAEIREKEGLEDGDSVVLTVEVVV